MYDLIIIGGGPAGAAAGVYAGRKKMKTLLITESFGGQSIVSDNIENWIGTKKLSGFELAKTLEEHIRTHENVEIKMPEKTTVVKVIEGGWEISTDKSNVYQSKTLIVASGGRRRRLNIPGEDKFNGKGVSYCSTCDAPLFKDKIVAIVGAGNAGAEAVIDLNQYALKIYWINRGLVPTADPETVEEIKKLVKVSAVNNVETQEITGEKFVSGLKYLDKQDNQIKELPVGGVFVEIGSVPNSEFMKDLVEMNKGEEIIVDHKTGATSKPGIFAAGDVTDEIYKQNNISAGDGVAAALSAYNYLLKINKRSPSYE
ncbi:MAG: Pyridine nucleotide-disulfide oxidoreductase, FAD/NAD(P)-binding domain-containing protein [Parcubacteria group bacterium GW2011_GWC1_43_11]|uniref:Pyridine nucleotide-disulfide oxidoreductase, FAD/NAD(P)-binding domain-containing protein n=1 Tax=Candidatus Azambacteria bacterium GW2011_GWA1_42_19 TaxID=1618609 RepID=A0A0G1C740_9BACT|nr:MAG: Pyridine nucleotide-disulfide oxidoreductase, FAD/NAD(P)-binding domain-containing protein [Candidatus Azambacteria bacterium GW2011_GWA1_42_19]KKS88400.1 MAG: Pyridine nucleotide-disulfide oxidoreductase, FAD/NAD(P)-binding domain-containing protein [Parcubacteria group bacterium GW2011_GWC1_43_11]